MWKFLLLLVAAYAFYRLFANDFFKKKKEDEKMEQEEAERKVVTGEMVKDPECGAYVVVDGSISVRDGQRSWHFCSYECRDKFLQRLEAGGATLPGSEKDQ